MSRTAHLYRLRVSRCVSFHADPRLADNERNRLGLHELLGGQLHLGQLSESVLCVSLDFGILGTI